MLITLALFSQNLVAQEEASWKVLPKVCLVDSFSQQCKMQLSISLSAISSDDYCIFQDQNLLGCWPAKQQQMTLEIIFVQETVLSLRNKKGVTLLEQTLLVKARREPKLRRRIKQPWSLF